ncbi:hypothetical protein [Pseudomonas sp.]|uniref:hypothetical protein n=1 Tax=Pseudomonas sp. TaxID=306 RepID=UPI003A9723E9
MKISSGNVKLTKLKGAGRIYWHLSCRGRTCYEFVNYMLTLNADYSEKTIEGYAYNLAPWFVFLDEASLQVAEASDECLLKYKEYLEWKHGVSRSAKIKASRKLMAVYKFYHYFSSVRRDIFNLIGPSGCNITSSITSHEDQSFNYLYPYCYRRIGRSSRHGVRWTPDQSHKCELFFALTVGNEYISRRNRLLVEIADEVGLRCGSILSLTTDQFPPLNESDLEKEFIYITPSSQKFGYSKPFPFLVELYLRIVAFIEGERRDLVIRFNNSSDKIFLNYHTGKPLTQAGTSSLFSRLSRQLKWPNNSGLHSWRRKFAQDFNEKNIEDRRRLGLDTSHDALALDLAARMGHESIQSQRPYIERAMQRYISKRTKTFSAQLADYEAEIAHLQKQLKAYAVQDEVDLNTPRRVSFD